MIGRRGLATGVAAGLSAALPVRFAIAQELPEIRWRLVSSYPTSLAIPYGAAVEFARVVDLMSGGRFRVDVFAAGEIVPGLQVLDAVQNGTVQLGHGPTFFYSGKDPTFTLFAAAPFGLNGRMQNAWLQHGGGGQLLDAFLEPYGVAAFPAGNSGCSMGGWFAKEITSLADLKGLKFRIPGIAGDIWRRLGTVPQAISPADIYPALERGTIDAAEFSNPADDENLGLYQVAKYYYYPGWWEPGTANCLFVNRKAWQALPPEYQAIATTAASHVNGWMTARYDAANPAALKRLVAAGALLRPFPPEVTAAAWTAAKDVYADLSTRNPTFKKVHDHLTAFRDDQYLWWQVAEFNYDAFMVQQRRG